MTFLLWHKRGDKENNSMWVEYFNIYSIDGIVTLEIKRDGNRSKIEDIIQFEILGESLDS